jgi:tRNA A37 methylthiotransferase MiaB
MTKFDVVIAALPYIETQEPMMAPALLKGVVNKTNLTTYTFDFNAEVIGYINKHFSSISDKIARWFLYEENNDCAETKQAIAELVEYVKNRILEKNPDWICLSLFCNTAKKFNIELCKSIKKTTRSCKIVIGGNAVFTDEKSQRPYALICKKAGFIDHYIVGDGEEPLYNLLTGKVDGIDTNQFQVLDDLSKQPYSDYSDYDWNLYTNKRVPMYGSRGCVRRCTFCDVYKLWKKFKLKSAEDVFAEMLYQIQETGISNFYFRDSLINGSISEYRKLIKLIADYNNTAIQKISWTSFFIFRPKEQMTEQDWQLTAASGAQDLIVGVESLVDSIRYHMRKKFTNTDIDYALEMAAKYQVGITILLIIGYVNETEQDFNESLEWLTQHQQYAGFPIHSLSVGGTLTVTDLTDLYQNAEEFDITIGNKIYLWENKSINLDYETRERRKHIFVNHARKLGYPIDNDEKPVQ